MTKKIRVAVVFGGRSAEHEVSNLSARSVLQALDPQRYEVLAVGIDRAGVWRSVEGPPALEAGATSLPAIDPSSGPEVSLEEAAGSAEMVRADGSRSSIDVVFPVLHGPGGEDGTIQGMFELARVPYVGAGVLASALGMDKAIQKVLFRSAGLPVVAHEVVRDSEWREDPDAVLGRAAALGYPVFTKPSGLGSSIGISKVKGPADLPAALDEAFRHDEKSLIERSMEGAREIECGVLGNDEPVASVPGEIVPGSEFYDYRAKYLDSDTRLEIPADLPEDVVEWVQQLSVAAFRAIDCAGMARVDFFLRGQELVLNEINTIPGFTEVSMYPKLWSASGVPYGELVDRLIGLALERRDSPGPQAT